MHFFLTKPKMYKTIIACFFLSIFACSAAASEVVEYIPKDLDDAHVQLLKILPKEAIDRVKAMKSEEEMTSFHFGLGMNIRNTWGLWQGSQLSRYFNSIGIQHPDDMSGIIFKTFWRKLHGKPLDLEKSVAYYQEYWLSMAKPKGGSPTDGSRIAWVLSTGERKTMVHLGISASDRSYWRFAYAGSNGIERATKEESIALDELQKSWKAAGITVEEMLRDREAKTLR